MTFDAPGLSNSRYAACRKDLLALVKKLRAIGAQSDLDLPRIAVIGNQSAGKSSVVEAISGISVPRDAGTCTRCPMECRLSSSTEPWSCEVFIRWEFRQDGSRNDDILETRFGEVITDKSKVEFMLQRAQAAVLNPHISPDKFLNMSAKDLKNGLVGREKSLLFSRNIVCVDLQGPDLTDLSFIDLPGIIQNAEPDVVQLVEDLVVSHIKDNCLILVALPMTDDIENQRALRLALQVDPAARRTIGVLTKPDMLATGSTKARDLWLDVIEGRCHPLKLGYFCTRQPDDAERAEGITMAQAREAEAVFFRTTPPWNTSQQRERFGTNSLVVNLSRLLVQIINGCLPKYRSETKKQLQVCERELSTLPKAIDMEPATYMLTLITEFCAEVQNHVRGGVNYSHLIQENRAAYKDLKVAIRKTAPHFVPCSDVTQHMGSFKNHKDECESTEEEAEEEEEEEEDGDGDEEEDGEELGEGDKDKDKDKDDSDDSDDSDEDEDEHRCKDEQAGRAPAGRAPAQASRAQAQAGRAPTQACQAPAQADQTPQRKEHQHQHKAPAKGLVDGKQPLYLNDMRKHIEKSITRELPNNVPFEAKLALIRVFQKNWKQTVFVCFDRVHESLCKLLTEIAKEKFKLYENLQTDMITFTVELVQQHYSSCRQFLEVTLSCEEMPFTQNHHYLETNTEKWLSVYKDCRAYHKGLALERQAKQRKRELSQISAPPIRPLSNKNSDLAKSTSAIVVAAVSKKRPAPSDYSVPDTNKKAKLGGTIENPAPVHATKSDQSERVKKALSALAKLGYVVKKEDLGKLNPVDEYERELVVMAEVRGYFQVAYKRIIDSVPSLIDLMLVKAAANGLQPCLITKLGLGTSDAKERCTSYLAEDPDVIAHRDELTARKKRLESVDRELRNFGL